MELKHERALIDLGCPREHLPLMDMAGSQCVVAFKWVIEARIRLEQKLGGDPDACRDLLEMMLRGLHFQIVTVRIDHKWDAKRLARLLTYLGLPVPSFERGNPDCNLFTKGAFDAVRIIAVAEEARQAL